MSDHFTGFNCCVQERLNRQYDEAVRLSESESVRELQKACERFEALGDFRDSEEKLRLCRGKLRECLQAFEGKIAAGYGHTVGLRADGTVITVGSYDDELYEAEEWEDIIAIAACSFYTVGLCGYGCIVSAGDDKSGKLYTNALRGSRGIAAVAAGDWHFVCLWMNGDVSAYGNSGKGECETLGWEEINAVAAGNCLTVGLKENGTVLAVGSNESGQCNTEDWREIVAVAVGDRHTVGLKADGTVVATGSNSYGQCNAEDWREIVAVAAGHSHTVGLRADGTVKAVGDNQHGQCNTEDWREIVAIAAGNYFTVGLRVDGTVKAVGDNRYGQLNTDGWKLL
ncbi:MAG: chromosome condensation regulator [Clostridia bacterium]|nr:chromosome condensation regulator [Clostridia bacterium]